jgi:hypothetical protein
MWNWGREKFGKIIECIGKTMEGIEFMGKVVEHIER